jgi:hypothetical protein
VKKQRLAAVLRWKVGKLRICCCLSSKDGYLNESLHPMMPKKEILEFSDFHPTENEFGAD